MDKLNKNDEKKETIKFDYLSNEEALTMAIDFLKSNYAIFIEEFKNE